MMRPNVRRPTLTAHFPDYVVARQSLGKEAERQAARRWRWQCSARQSMGNEQGRQMGAASDDAHQYRPGGEADGAAAASWASIGKPNDIDRGLAAHCTVI